MIRRPPRSTLCPYTDALPTSARLEAKFWIPPMEATCPGDVATSAGKDHTLAAANVRLAKHTESSASARAALDRKSTRLNSSHANISYAVFCLKKKTLPLRHSA